MSIDMEEGELVRLISRCCEGDQVAWQRIYQTYYPLVFGYVQKHLRCRVDSADVTQDTFIKAFRNIRQLRKATQFPGWLLVTAKRTLINFVVRGEKSVAVPFEVLDALADTVDPPETEDYAWLRSELNSLVGPCGETARRHYLKGDSIKAIARDMNCPPGTVKRRLFDARQRLKSSVWAAPWR